MAQVLRPLCSIRDCDRTAKGRGYCKKHYHQYVFLVRRPLWNVYQNMLRRCHDKKHPRYEDWGGRGIQVCERWRMDYFAFAADVGERPTPFHQLDRIDNSRGYEPGNVRWATPSQQGLNRRRRRNVKSPAKGIEVRPNGFVARITIEKRRIYLGTFKTLSEAKYARYLAEARIT